MDDRRQVTSGAGPDGVERRRGDRRDARRHRVQVVVSLSDGSNLTIHASRDISRGGVFLANAIPYAAGTELHVRFQLPGEGGVIECLGEVVNVSHVRLGMGVRFVTIRADDANRIERFGTSPGRARSFVSDAA
jgi:hypothetical protein